MEGSSGVIHVVVKPEMLEVNQPQIPLTIDELENKSGKNFEAMNMDEFLHDMWNMDGNSDTNENDVANHETATNPLRLSTQNSFPAPTPMCNETLDEVWDEIVRKGSSQNNPNVNENSNGNDLHQDQQTPGEMTLDDFLVKMGVIQDRFHISRPKVESDQNSYGSFLNNGMYLGPYNGQGSMMMGLEHTQSNGKNMAVNGDPMYPVYTTSGIFVGEGSKSIEKNWKRYNIQISENTNDGTNRRPSNERVEHPLERRRRRMIKNRESAARSRARKNAYTCELEHELDMQRKENAMLRLMLAESENKRKQVNDSTSTKTHPRKEKLKRMRRTLSW